MHKKRIAIMEEIPALYPTEQEFKNPIYYLSNPHIKRLGVRYGMVKVVPPNGFCPPLSIDMENFTFQPRIQNLENLDLKNRCRLFFMKQLNNFKRSVKDPSKLILREPYTIVEYSDSTHASEILKKKVYFYDVFSELIKDNRTLTDTTQSFRRKLKFRDISQLRGDSSLWRTISKKFNVPIGLLKEIFEKYIASYYIFLHSLNENVHTALHADQYPKSLLSDDEDDFDLGPDSNSGSDFEEDDDDACIVCRKTNDPKRTILCDSCDKPFHIYCLSPPLERVPSGDWICNTCIVGNGYYGFTQDTHDYSLPEFQEYCKHQSSRLLPARKLSIDELEEMFWSLVTKNRRSSLTTVKYGADIHNELPGQITGNVMIVFTCLFIFFFAISWAPIAYVIVAESYPLRVKNRAMAIAVGANWIWGFLIGFFTPFITSAIGFSYGYVFMGCLVFSFFYVFFFVCETKGLTLEEVNEMYVEGVKPWKSGSWISKEKRVSEE